MNSSGNTEILFGAGVALVNAFTISWGLSTSHAESYVLLGVSAPDLVKVFK